MANWNNYATRETLRILMDENTSEINQNEIIIVKVSFSSISCIYGTLKYMYYVQISISKIYIYILLHILKQ